MAQKMIESVFESEQELLKAMITIHSPGGIELDPMFYKGNFYKEIPQPNLIFDLNPQVDGCAQADARKLPLKDNSIRSMILDPPFMFDVGGKAREYYSSSTHGIYNNFEEMIDSYRAFVAEGYRILKRGGILVFKCQDYRGVSTHCIIRNIALEIGFREKDIAILHLSKNKVWNPNLPQRIFRKTHTYFWVFQKISVRQGVHTK